MFFICFDLQWLIPVPVGPVEILWLVALICTSAHPVASPLLAMGASTMASALAPPLAQLACLFQTKAPPTLSPRHPRSQLMDLQAVLTLVSMCVSVTFSSKIFNKLNLMHAHLWLLPPQVDWPMAVGDSSLQLQEQRRSTAMPPQARLSSVPAASSSHHHGYAMACLTWCHRDVAVCLRTSETTVTPTCSWEKSRDTSWSSLRTNMAPGKVDVCYSS